MRVCSIWPTPNAGCVHCSACTRYCKRHKKRMLLACRIESQSNSVCRACLLTSLVAHSQCVSLTWKGAFAGETLCLVWKRISACQWIRDLFGRMVHLSRMARHASRQVCRYALFIYLTLKWAHKAYSFLAPNKSILLPHLRMSLCGIAVATLYKRGLCHYATPFQTIFGRFHLLVRGTI